MSENTTHVEGLEFRATDAGASAVAEKISHAFHQLHGVAEKTKERIHEVGREMVTGALASMGLGFGLMAVFEKAKEANIEMDRVKKSVAGAQLAFQGWKTGVSSMDRVRHSMSQAAEITEHLEEMEIKLHAPLEELGRTYTSAAALGFSRLGMSQKEVIELTEQMTAAGVVYGMSGEEAISKVTRAIIRGRVAERDMSGFAIQMRDWIGPMKKGQKLGPEEMMERLRKSMGNMVPAARAFGDNLEGSMKEAHALVNKMLEELGGPVFREQTKALSEWVRHLREAKEGGKNLIEIYGEKIAKAFNALKTATKYIADHWKEIAAAYVAMKMGGGLAGLAGGLGGMGGLGGALVNHLTTFSLGVNGSTQSLAMFSSKLLGAAGQLGLFYLALKAGANWLDKYQTAQINKQSRWGAGSVLEGSEGSRAARHMEAFRGLLGGEGFKADYKDGMAKARETMTSYQAAFGGDVISKAGVVNQGLAMQMWDTMSESAKQRQATGLGLASTATGQEFVSKLSELIKIVAGLLPGGEGEVKPNKTRKAGNVPQVNIQNLTITQDFKEADPDRVFHKITNEIAGLASSPGTSRFHVRGGI